jgi:hypothetical protein
MANAAAAAAPRQQYHIASLRRSKRSALLVVGIGDQPDRCEAEYQRRVSPGARNGT